MPTKLTSNNERPRRIAKATIVAGLAAAALASCSPHNSGDKLTKKDISIARSLASEYSCKVLFLRDTHSRPDDYSTAGPLDSVNIKVELDAKPSIAKYFTNYGLFKDANISEPVSPVITGYLFGLHNGAARSESLVFPVDETKVDRLDAAGGRSILSNPIYIRPHAAGTMGDITVQTHIIALADPSKKGQTTEATVYGTMHCGQLEYGDNNTVRLSRTTSEQTAELQEIDRIVLK